MVTLKQLQSEYQSQVESNLLVSKNRRRYSTEFKSDMKKYISDGGSRARLSKWLGMGMDSLANHINKTSSSPAEAAEHVFIRVPELRQESHELVINYPGGVTVRLPLKL